MKKPFREKLIKTFLGELSPEGIYPDDMFAVKAMSDKKHLLAGIEERPRGVVQADQLATRSLSRATKDRRNSRKFDEKYADKLNEYNEWQEDARRQYTDAYLKHGKRYDLPWLKVELGHQERGFAAAMKEASSGHIFQPPEKSETYDPYAHAVMYRRMQELVRGSGLRELPHRFTREKIEEGYADSAEMHSNILSLNQWIGGHEEALEGAVSAVRSEKSDA